MGLGTFVLLQEQQRNRIGEILYKRTVVGEILYKRNKEIGLEKSSTGETIEECG